MKQYLKSRLFGLAATFAAFSFVLAYGSRW